MYDIDKIENYVKVGFRVVDIAGGIYKKFNNDELCNKVKVDVNERKEQKEMYEEIIRKEQRKERKLYQLLKDNNNVDIEEVEGKKKLNNKEMALLVMFPMQYIGCKILINGYNKYQFNKEIAEKYKIFKDMFKECGLKEKMMNEYDYKPNNEELEKLVHEYKLEAGIELVDVLEKIYKK